MNILLKEQTDSQVSTAVSLFFMDDGLHWVYNYHSILLSL